MSRDYPRFHPFTDFLIESDRSMFLRRCAILIDRRISAPQKSLRNTRKIRKKKKTRIKYRADIRRGTSSRYLFATLELNSKSSRRSLLRSRLRRKRARLYVSSEENSIFKLRSNCDSRAADAAAETRRITPCVARSHKDTHSCRRICRPEICMGIP